MDLNHLSKISELLPEQFGFYDQGRLEKSSVAEPSDLTSLDFNLLRGVGFRIYHLDDAPSALLLFVFASDLDESMYTEMGNILASKLCQNLTHEEKLEMMISPPIQVKGTGLKRLAATGLVRRLYQHTYVLNGSANSIQVEAWTLPAGTAEVSHV